MHLHVGAVDGVVLLQKLLHAVLADDPNAAADGLVDALGRHGLGRGDERHARADGGADCFDALAERGILVPQFRIFPSYRSRPDTTTASYSESCFLSTVGRPSSIGISQIYIPSSS